MVSSTTAVEQPCPDPSVHQKHNKLSEQASTAALLAAHPPERPEVLNPDGKLSSKSAATSLKYANAQDLPSFPSHGIDTERSAGKAAMLAKDYKMKELWQPELSSAGSRAALLAHKDGGKVDLWQPSASADGNSAAQLAMKNKTLSPQLDYGYTKDGHNNALLAATQSQRAGRQRAGSTPVTLPIYPDSANSASNALNAATISHRASVKQRSPLEPDGWDSAAMQAARIQNIGDHLDRKMYTERPPVEIELQEKRDKDALRASAISMAKQMYDAQNKASTASTGVDGKNLRSGAVGTQSDMKQEAMRYIHLQDAAHKLAQERLAKVDKNFEQLRYREYYGYNTSPQKSRLSMGSFMRKRASSETAKDELDSDDDEQQARRVRGQMSQFNSAVAAVDAKKQQTDRDALLAIAQKRVQKSMRDMDAKIYGDTGKVSQAMMDDWEDKARRRATEDAEKREVNRGKTHIGAGKYMDTSEIEAIAAARLKPTLDEINDNVERRRARDEELRLQREQEEKLRQQEKQRAKDSKDEWKRFKAQEKAETKIQKEEVRREKEERKTEEQEAHRSLLSRLSVKRRSRETNKKEAGEVAATAAAGTTLGEVAEKVKEDHDTIPQTPERQPTTVHAATTSPREESSLPLASVGQEDHVDESDKLDDDSQHKSKGIKGLFSKLRRKSHADEEAVVGSAAIADKQHEKGSTQPAPVVASTVTEPPTLPEHVGTDGPIGSTKHVSGVAGNAGAISPSSFRRHDVDNDADISSLSSGVDEEDFRDGKTGRSARAERAGQISSLATSNKALELTAPSSTIDSPDLDDEDEETYEEARDTVDPATAPEPAFVGVKDATQHGRETKFQEVL